MTPTKKAIAGTIAAVTLVGGSLAAPVIPQDMVWANSYCTYEFATDDGDIDFNEYARIIRADGTEKIVYRDAPKDEAAHIIAPEGFEIPKNWRQVEVVGEHKCYSRFINKKGGIVREPIEFVEYDKLRTVKDAARPKKLEYISILEGERAEAAIAYDAISNDTAGGTDTNSISWSHTAVAISNTYVVVSCLQDNDLQTFTETFDGSGMTELFEVNSAGGIGDHHLAMAYASVGSSGAKTVVCSSTATDSFNGVAATYTGVASVDDTSDQSSGGDSGVEPSITITTVSGSMGVMACGLEAAGLSTTPGPGQTNRFRDQTFTVEPQGIIFEEEPASGASVTMTCERTGTGTLQWTIGGVELVEAGGGGATPVADDLPVVIWEE